MQDFGIKTFTKLRIFYIINTPRGQFHIIEKRKQTAQMTYNEELNQCLAAIKNGDETQFADLHRLTYGPLKNVAKSYLIDKSYADAVVNDLYYKIYRYAARYDTSRDALTYLWQIVKNKAFDYNRRYKKDKWINIDDIPISDIIDPYELVNVKIDLERALGRLKMKEQLIIIWTYTDGLTQEEIGKRLDVSKSAVNQRLKKIKNKLREFLK